MLSKAYILEHPKIEDSRGVLSFFENYRQIPFPIRRNSWVYQMPREKTYGDREIQTSQEFVVALGGSFEVLVGDGKEEKSFILNCPHQGLYLPTGLWRCIQNFSEDALALIVTDK